MNAIFSFPSEYMNKFYGYKVVEDVHMVDVDNPIITEVKRTLKERLFTLPWRPFKKTKIVTTYPPLKSFYLMDTMLICHPVMKQSLIAAMRTEGNIA